MAWRDGMLEQGRRVPARRMEWRTLSAKDRVLDRKIADRLNELARTPEPNLDHGWEAYKDSLPAGANIVES